MEPTVSTMADVVTAMTTAVTSIASSALSGISAIVPVAAPILGAMMILGLGIKAFRKFTGR